jgi:hypothetical protein
MSENGVKIDPSVIMDGLSAEERQLILESVRRLQETDPAQWPKDQVIALPQTKPTYLLRLPGTMRVIFERHESGELEIEALVRQETLDWFRQMLANGDPAR